MAHYYQSYYPSSPGSGPSSSRASSGSPLSSLSQSSQDSTGYFPPSPYYYTEYSSSPSDYSYQASLSPSSRSSSSQGHYRHPSSSSTSSSSNHHQPLGYESGSQCDGRTKRQRVAVPVDASGHLQPHYMGSQADFAAGMYHPHSQHQHQLPHQLQYQHQHQHQHQHQQHYPQHAQMMSSSSSSYPAHLGSRSSRAISSPSASVSPSASSSSSAPASSRSPSHPGSHHTRMQGSAATHARARAHEEEAEAEAEAEPTPFEHGPTELPPRTFAGHSKFNPPKKPGKIPGSAMDYLPILEARFERLETAIDRYIEHRGQRALNNSILPGSTNDSSN